MFAECSVSFFKAYFYWISVCMNSLRDVLKVVFLQDLCLHMLCGWNWRHTQSLGALWNQLHTGKIRDYCEFRSFNNVNFASGSDCSGDFLTFHALLTLFKGLFCSVPYSEGFIAFCHWSTILMLSRFITYSSSVYRIKMSMWFISYICMWSLTC